ncbi:hypothetical protein ACHAPE_006839 [Trichoderma viride]
MASSGPPPPNSRDDFEIAIVCALAVEYDAVSLLIDQFWDEDGDKYGRATRDRNTYTTGRMGSFDIVLLLLPNAGKVSAASAASGFRTSFPNITLALLVGTCGGVPYTKDNEEILLGDVVISKTVIQYDLGSQHTGQFLMKETLEERLGRPDLNIRGIVRIMETDHERERLKNRAAVLLEQLQSHARRKKMQKSVKYEYEYPGISKDRLFEAGYLHKHQVLLPYRCCEELPCDSSHTLSCVDLGCEDEYLVQRQRLDDQAQSLSIFIGQFGSGDTTLKSGTYRNEIAQRHGLLAFEMEGAGIWDELPCIIVKGISNYADGHWNADSSWQQFAAATAAATARALIERYPKTDKVRRPLDVLENRREKTKEQDECLRDMHVTDPSVDKNRIQDTNGTLLRDAYIWILANAEFTHWRKRLNSGLLWIKGDPGKGKTMLICGLIDELQADGVTQPYYFFCQASDSRLNNATKVLCSLVYSIACQYQEALSFVMEKYKHAGKELFYNINAWTALSQIMTRILQSLDLKDKVFIFDGLDECVTDLPLLLDFLARAPGLSEARWIVSSRNWPNIEEKLNASPKKLPLSLELNEQSISDAVRIYVQHKVNKLATDKGLDENSRGALQAYLTDNANGTFLWVSLVCKKLSDGEVRKRHLPDLMKTFPSGLVPLYERMMAQVCNSIDADICIQVLEMASLTYQPISLTELASFVQISVNDDGLEELKNIVAACGSFLVLKDDVVYFVHQSAKDFLLNNTSKQIFICGIARKHHDIFSESIRILSQTLRRDIYELRHPGALIPSVLNVPNPDPLEPLQYACLYWVDHLRDSSEETISQGSLQDDEAVHCFLKDFLFYWLEALCLIGKLSEGIIAVKTLESLTAQDLGLLHMFMRDARRFVLSFRLAIEHTPLQLYSSALLFTPASSIVRQTFAPNQAKWISQKPSVRLEWDACLQTLEGHEDDITFLAFSPDNTRLASYDFVNNLKVWDRATGACLQSLTFDHPHWETCMVFSPDSSQLALAIDIYIKILDPNTGTCITTLDNGEYYESMIYSPNGMQLILSNQLWEDDDFRIWDLTTEMQLPTEDYYKDVREPAVFQHNALDIDEDEGEISDKDEASDEDAITVVRSPMTGSRVLVHVVGKHHLAMAVFALDGKLFALIMEAQKGRIGESGPIYIVEAATGRCLQKLTNCYRFDKRCAFSPDGSQLAAVSRSRYVGIWDVKTGACLLSVSNAPTFNTFLGFSPDGAELASVAKESIKIWDLTLGSSVDPVEEETVYSVTYSPDSTRLALITNYHDGTPDPFTIEIWDPVAGICQQQLQVGSSTRDEAYFTTPQLAFSPDNTQLAYSRWNEIAIRDLAANPQHNRCEFEVSSDPKSIIFSPNGSRLAVAGDKPHSQRIRYAEIPSIATPKIEIRDAINGAIVYTFYLATAIEIIQFSSDGNRLGSLSREGIAAIWDLNTGARLQTFDSGLVRTLSVDNKTWPMFIYGSRSNVQCSLTIMLQNPDSMPDIMLEFDNSPNMQWLVRRGKPFLWLPTEYRSLNFTFAGGNIAIVLSHKKLVLISLSLVELDAEMASNRSSIVKV